MKNLALLIIFNMIACTLYSQQGWTTQNSGTTSPLRDIFMVDQYTGWIVAHQNTILKTTDGGENWFEQTPLLVPYYYDVYFIDNQTGWILGEYETIAHTTDGGDTWETQTSPGHNPGDIFFINADTGWIAGGRTQGFPGPSPLREILHTGDGGNTWAIQYQVDFEFPLGSIHFADDQTGCTVGDLSAILFTTDGGENWTQQTSPVSSNLEEVYMKSPTEGWIVGTDGVILHTTDGGANWNQISSGTTYSLTDVDFINEKGWISGGSNDDATILYNDGLTESWTMQDPGTTDYLSAISFVDEKYGWAVGFNGTIVHTTTGGMPLTDYDLQLKVFLEGPFNGTDMTPALNPGNIPLQHPYNTPPWNYTGSESVPALPSADIIDWVLIEVRDATDAASAGESTVIDRGAAFLLKDGTIRDLDASSHPVFGLYVADSLYVVVHHRNHLSVMSSVALTETGGIYPYDFSASDQNTFGGPSGIKELIPATWGMIGGDGNADGSVDSDDKVNIWENEAGSAGYLYGDFDMDTQDNNTDKAELWELNEGYSSQVPD